MERPNIGPTPGTAEYDDLKKKINAEGTQVSDDGEGEGALYIGSEKEIKEARAKAESGGAAPDVASYIRLNKKVIGTIEDIETLAHRRETESLVDIFRKMPVGTTAINSRAAKWNTLYFKDSQGQLAIVDVDLDKIAELNNLPEAKYGEPYRSNRLFEELVGIIKGKGFTINNELLDTVLNLQNWIQANHNNKEKEEIVAGFNF
jgi:hypothetical protein